MLIARNPAVVLLSILILVLPPAGRTEEVPTWEAGIGFGAVYLPDYRGANEESFFVSPWPYLVYYGERVNLDREGLRGRIFRSPRVTLVGSIGAATPVDSEDNEARAGMPDLDFTFEIGPALEVDLWQGEADSRLLLRVPLRGIIVTDFSDVKGIGWVFAPQLEFRIAAQMRGEWDTNISVGPLFATERYHDYYYRVEAAYATPSRPEYDPGGGYSGSRFSVGTSTRKGRMWYGAYLRYDDLSGAVFRDSPLVKTRNAFVIGGGMAYVFAQSKETRTISPYASR